jgi:hypothetical protein
MTRRSFIDAAGLQAAVALIAGAFAALTLLVPDWIEATTGLDPDAGSGAVEVIVVLLLAAVALAAGRSAYRNWMRAPRGAGAARP